eukprot:TRINITY_DN2947_c0_g1_i1.p1 TRINITY_DN2947_c0_g1~~TRINITY_DN2947_c0_g1_i1.p1  ORF type:complete len:493 (-),score=101.76 TRINITY_DN2947_c0_g1_i1:9-1487(-)
MNETELAAALFGDAPPPVISVARSKASRAKRQLPDVRANAEVDLDASDDDLPAPHPPKKAKTAEPEKPAPADAGLKPVWVDEDDAAIAVSLAAVSRRKKLRQNEEEDVIAGTDYAERLRQQFARTSQNTDWASLARPGRAGNEDFGRVEEEDDALLRSTARLTGKPAQLPPRSIRIVPVKDGNAGEPSQCVIQSVQFHPNGQLMLTAGFDKTLRLYQIDGRKNTKVQSVFFRGVPLHTATFTPDGSRIYCSGRRHFFFRYDVLHGAIEQIPQIVGISEKSLERMNVSSDGKYLSVLGADGNVHFVSTQTHKLIHSVRMNNDVSSIAFSPDGNYSLTTGVGGEIYRWDMRTFRCVGRHADEGSVRTSSLAFSPRGNYYAAGSTTGVVNLYDPDTTMASRTPKPIRTIPNLVTNTNLLRFNSDAQLLAIGSSSAKDALRLVHLPTGTVYANWPTSSTALGAVSALDFSPNSGYLAVGNEAGRVLLFRLAYYTSS